MASKEDDLQPEQTDGFKVGEKKTVEEYAKLGKAVVQSTVCMAHISQNAPVAAVQKITFSMFQLYLEKTNSARSQSTS